MKIIPYRLDDAVKEIAREMADEVSSATGKKLKNNQIRKFWDNLKMERNSQFARVLALHQMKKAEKEEKNAKKKS